MSDDVEHGCSTCLAFHATGSGAGECRRYAPAPGSEGAWPRVESSDWCLQHRQSVEPFGLTFIPVDRVDNFGSGDG